MNQIVRASAPAKINLFFSVGPVRADGYHDVTSLYQAISIRDSIAVSSSTDWQVQLNSNVAAGDLLELSPQDNIVVKAANALAAHLKLGTAHPVKFEITKNIPIAAGLAGGSADAAAALIAINELWCTGVAISELQKLAVTIGADVPFALIGETAIGVGVGEQLTTVSDAAPLHWLIAPSSLGLSTPAVYGELDRLRAARRQEISNAADVPNELVEALQTGNAEVVANHLHNDLQEAAISLRPELQSTITAGVAAGALAAMISGSGPTILFLAKDEEHASRLGADLEHQRINTWYAASPAPGTELSS